MDSGHKSEKRSQESAASGTYLWFT